MIYPRCGYDIFPFGKHCGRAPPYPLKIMKKYGKILTLFLVMLKISSTTFGGGFVIVTFMKNEFVDKRGRLTDEQMLDITALAQSAPGAIAVNAAILVGKTVAGAAGIAAAVIGTVIPPIVILSVISLFYNAFCSNVYVAYFLKGVQAGVAALLADVTLSLGKTALKKDRVLNAILMISAFCISFFTKINVVFIILAVAGTGVAVSLISIKREAEK